jgi:hypothetical protein
MKTAVGMRTSVARTARPNLTVPPQPGRAQTPAHPLAGARVPYSRFPTTLPHVFAIPPRIYTAEPATTVGTIVAARTKRQKMIPLRVHDWEKQGIEEQAAAAGLSVSEYLRVGGMTGFATRAPVTPTSKAAPSSDREQRVNEAARRMPRSAAEKIVSREEARERAKALLG